MKNDVTPFPFEYRLIAGVSPELDDQDTLYIFKMSITTNTTFEQLGEGRYVVRYDTELGRTFFSPEVFNDTFEAILYYADIANRLLEGGGRRLNIKYWRDRYPDFPRCEIIRYSYHENTHNLALAEGKLQLKTLA